MKQLSVAEIREKTLDMMDHIHAICVANGIQYFLYYGTLIGAVRHNGFIPWDDDFDIAMKREDYIKFCHIVAKEKHPYFRLCNRANTENYYYGIARYSDTRYRYISDIKELKQAEMGIFIDIYPLDYCGNSPEEAERIMKPCIKLNADYIIYMNRRSVQGGIRTLLRTPVHYLYRLKYGKGFSGKIDRMIYQGVKAKTSDQDKLIGVLVWESTCWAFDKKLFEHAVLHRFEDREYLIPEGYDEILRMVYGDYMQLPPEEQRVPTHNYHIVETEEM